MAFCSAMLQIIIGKLFFLYWQIIGLLLRCSRQPSAEAKKLLPPLSAKVKFLFCFVEPFVLKVVFELYCFLDVSLLPQKNMVLRWGLRIFRFIWPCFLLSRVV